MDEDSESAFDPAHIKYEIIEKVVKATFAEKGSPNPETGEAMYVEWSDSKRDSWVKDIIEGVLAKLAIFNEELSKQEGASVFKFVVTASVQQKYGASLHTSTAQYWDTTTDAYTSLSWECDQIQCVVMVFGVQN